MDIQEKISQILAQAPHQPGVYLMKEAGGAIIYIGKANSLKKRLSSYFRKTGLDPKTLVLVRHISDIDYIVTDSEMEALLLECNLIKKHKPKYNIRLKDDKRYPYIVVTLGDEYPRVLYTRRIFGRGHRHFGPYTDARAAKNISAMINEVFKLKRCSKVLPLKKNERPCLNFQLKKCTGVCTGKISKEEYRTIVENAVRFLEGNAAPVLENLQSMMKKYSESFEYEKAAQIRDMIFDIQTVSESQKVDVPALIDQDYIAAGIHGHEAIVVLFEFRKGVLLGRKISVFENVEFSAPDEIYSTFIMNYYEHADVPQRVITGGELGDRDVLEAYLSGRSASRVALSPALTADDRGIISMIDKNIMVIASDRQASRENQDTEIGLDELRESLELDSLPELIECFDISNFQGTNAVASMVRFRDGRPEKSGYRRYRIRGYDSPNDPGMIHEVVARRIQHLVNEGLPLPDLMVIDGGPTQLARAMEAAANFDVAVRIISIAKKREELFTSPVSPPVLLPEDSPGLHIIQNIRDEAHRFAITYHRKLRDRSFTRSVLDEIPLSARQQSELLRHFKSIEGIAGAAVEELAVVPGIGRSTAEKINGFFLENRAADFRGQMDGDEETEETLPE